VGIQGHSDAGRYRREDGDSTRFSWAPRCGHHGYRRHDHIGGAPLRARRLRRPAAGSAASVAVRPRRQRPSTDCAAELCGARCKMQRSCRGIPRPSQAANRGESAENQQDRPRLGRAVERHANCLEKDRAVAPAAAPNSHTRSAGGFSPQAILVHEGGVSDLWMGRTVFTPLTRMALGRTLLPGRRPHFSRRTLTTPGPLRYCCGTAASAAGGPPSAMPA